MRSITILICFILLMSNISHPAYGQDPAIKQELIELEALIDEQPPFFFRDGMYGKFLFKERLKQTILLVENDKLKEARNVIHNLLFEIEGPLVITNPISKDKIRQRLRDILIKLPED